MMFSLLHQGMQLFSKLSISRNTMGCVHVNLLLLLCCCVHLGTCQAPGTPIEYHIDEELPSRTMVGNITKSAGITNLTQLQEMEFSLAEQRESKWNLFIVDDAGILRTTETIDRDKVCAQEDVCAVNLRIIVQPIRYFRVIKVTVHIDDRNDNPPTFPRQTLQLSIKETATNGTLLPLPGAEDLDSAVNGISGYKINPDNGPFTLETRQDGDGEVVDLKLVLQQKLDREQEEYYTMWVTSVDRGQPQLTGSMLVQVKVLDANDNNPKFENDTYKVMLPENIPVGTTILQVKARDEDVGVNGEIDYEFSEATITDHSTVFGINADSGEIYVKGEIDYESSTLYHLTVIARDRGENSLPAYAKVEIHVEDLNDHAPLIDVNTLTPTGNAEISEGSPVGMFVAHVSVTDPDGGEIKCEMDSDIFALQDLYNSEYKVVTKVVFDRELRSEYHVNLVCQDRGQPPLTSTKHIAVTVTDKNDHTPLFTQEVYHHTMVENNGIGQTIVSLSTTDKDLGRNAATVFEVREANGQVVVDRITGVVTANQVFDYEHTKKYEFIVVAVDQGDPPRTSTATLIIDITDENDNKPVFSQQGYVFEIAENTSADLANVKIDKVVATDADSPPFNTILYSLDASNDNKSMDFQNVFSIDPNTGDLLLQQGLDRETQDSYSFKVKAENEGYPEVFSLVDVEIRVTDINDHVPIVHLNTFNFTTDGNDTIHLPNELPKGRVIASISASDADTGANAAVTFKLLNISDNLFRLDTGTGDIILNANLEGSPYHITHILIEASDKGSPKMSTTAELKIIVNRSVIAIAPPLNTDPESFWNTKSFFAIGIAGTCLFIIILTIISILIVKNRRKSKDKKHTYNCRLEAEKSSQCNGTSPPPGADHGKHNSSFEGDLKEPEKVTVQGVELGESCTDECWPKAQENPYVLDQTSKIDHNHKRDSGIEMTSKSSGSDSDSGIQRHLVPPQQHPPAYNRLSAQHTPIKEMELQVQDMLHMLLREKESPSETGSYTDSGKGPSEEGDHSHSWPDCHVDTTKGLPTVVEAHALALTDRDDRRHSHTDSNGAYGCTTAPPGGGTGHHPYSDDGIYVEAIPREHVYAQDPSRRAYDNRLYRAGGGQPAVKDHRPALPIPSYTPPPSYHDSVATPKRLVRFASYNQQPGEREAPTYVRAASDSESWSGDREDLYASVFREGVPAARGNARRGDRLSIASSPPLEENPYASYALPRLKIPHQEDSLYDQVDNLTYNKDNSMSDTYANPNNIERPKSHRKEGNKEKSRSKLQRTKAERLGETSTKPKKPKVQFWDEGPVDKCVHDIVAKYMPDRTENGNCLDSVDGFSDDDVTTESGSYVIDSDDFLRDKNTIARDAETMFVDYIVV